MGCFVYLIFGSSKDVTVGPTAIMALLAQQHVRRLGEDIAVSGSLLISLALIALSLLHGITVALPLPRYLRVTPNPLQIQA